MEARMVKSVKEIYEGLNVHVGFEPEDVAAVYKFFGKQIPHDAELAHKMSFNLYTVMEMEKAEGSTFQQFKNKIKKKRRKEEKHG